MMQCCCTCIREWLALVTKKKTKMTKKEVIERLELIKKVMKRLKTACIMT